MELKSHGAVRSVLIDHPMHVAAGRSSGYPGYNENIETRYEPVFPGGGLHGVTSNSVDRPPTLANESPYTAISISDGSGDILDH